MSELEARVERIEEELGIEQNDLPEFHDYQMEEVVLDRHDFIIYRDEDDEIWLEKMNDDDEAIYIPRRNSRRVTAAFEEVYGDD